MHWRSKWPSTSLPQTTFAFICNIHFSIPDLQGCSSNSFNWWWHLTGFLVLSSMESSINIHCISVWESWFHLWELFLNTRVTRFSVFRCVTMPQSLSQPLYMPFLCLECSSFLLTPASAPAYSLTFFQILAHSLFPQTSIPWPPPVHRQAHTSMTSPRCTACLSFVVLNTTDTHRSHLSKICFPHYNKCSLMAGTLTRFAHHCTPSISQVLTTEKAQIHAANCLHTSMKQ